MNIVSFIELRIKHQWKENIFKIIYEEYFCDNYLKKSIFSQTFKYEP